MDKGHFVLFDPVALDENNFMTFKKRITKQDILKRLQFNITKRIQQSIKRKNSNLRRQSSLISHATYLSPQRRFSTQKKKTLAAENQKVSGANENATAEAAPTVP